MSNLAEADSKEVTMDRSSVVFRPPRWWLAVEFVLLYIGFPLVVYALRDVVLTLVIPLLVITGGVLWALLWYDPDFDNIRLWNRTRFWDRFGESAKRFGMGAAALTVVIALTRPNLLLGMIREEPRVWMMIVLLYPFGSVYPQEVIFRAYPFHRYRRLFVHDDWLVLASAVGFTLAHLLFTNWVAIGLSAIGGFLFADTYRRTRSTLQAGLEHALWGIFLFTIGLGYYFYGGSVLHGTG